jgi:hypothetical protein
MKATDADALDMAVKLPGGGTIETVGEAFAFLDRLPKRTLAKPEWQEVVKQLHRAVTLDRAWLWFVRSALMRAIHGDAPPPPIEPTTKREAWRERRKAKKMARKTKD